MYGRHGDPHLVHLVRLQNLECQSLEGHQREVLDTNCAVSSLCVYGDKWVCIN